MAAIGTEAHLSFLLYEDGVDKTGMTFKKVSETHVEVWTTWQGYPECEEDSKKLMLRENAIDLWRELLAERWAWEGRTPTPVWKVQQRQNKPVAVDGVRQGVGLQGCHHRPPRSYQGPVCGLYRPQVRL